MPSQQVGDGGVADVLKSGLLETSDGQETVV
jgi:hypothetical protein